MKNTELRPCHPDDIEEVFINGSQVTKEEFGGMSYSELRDWANEVCDSGAVTVFHKGKPVAVFGHTCHPRGRDTRCTWFLSTEQFMEMGAKSIIYARNYMRRLQKLYPKTMFVSYTTSTHPHKERWFKALGFSFIERSGETSTFQLERGNV